MHLEKQASIIFHFSSIKILNFVSFLFFINFYLLQEKNLQFCNLLLNGANKSSNRIWASIWQLTDCFNQTLQAAFKINRLTWQKRSVSFKFRYEIIEANLNVTTTRQIGFQLVCHWLSPVPNWLYSMRSDFYPNRTKNSIRALTIIQTTFVTNSTELLLSTLACLKFQKNFMVPKKLDPFGIASNFWFKSIRE